MFRKLIPLLCAMLFTALPAFAQSSPVLSDDMLILQSANNALIERYGLTVHCLGLFSMDTTSYGSATIIRYASRGRPHPALTGEYAVVVTPEGVQTFWTHDEVDPAVWQSGELNSIAWGAPQLTAYLEADSFEREFFDAPYAPDPFEEWLTVEEHNQNTRVFMLRAGTLSQEAVQPAERTAREALRLMYGLSEETAAALHLIEATRLLHTDGSSEWLLSFYHNTEPDEINYGVTIGSDLQTILEVVCSTGGIG